MNLVSYSAQLQRIEDTNYSSHEAIHNMSFENKRRKKEHIVTSQHARNIDFSIEKDHLVFCRCASRNDKFVTRLSSATRIV